MEESRKLDYEHSSTGLVSVIIPTKNSSKTIAKCLQSIRNQTYKNIEVLVIDAFSSDDTQAISLDLGAQVIALDGERTKAKNIGLSKANGEFVFFVDSDMTLEPCVIEQCVMACSDKMIAGVVIPEHSVGDGFWVRVRDFERSFYGGSRIESARFFKKQCVRDVGGFDENYVFFEESTLPQKLEKLGMDVNARISSHIMHHEENFDLRRWLHKKRYYSESARKYAIAYPEYARLQISITYRLQLFVSNGRWKYLLRHPILTVGLFTLKIMEFISSKL